MMTIKTIKCEMYREKAEQIEENDGDGDNHDDDDDDDEEDLYIQIRKQ